MSRSINVLIIWALLQHANFVWVNCFHCVQDTFPHGLLNSPGFDHHCVWFAQCITLTHNLKLFVHTLFFAATTILLGLGPLYPIVARQVNLVVNLTWDSGSNGETLRRIWWDRWWSWAGGPIYRYMGGLCLGYLYYPKIERESQLDWNNTVDQAGIKLLSKSSLLSAQAIFSKPSFSMLLIITSGTMIELVIIAMLVIVIKNNILRGLSSIEIERARRWNKSSSTWDPRIKLWVPDCKEKGKGKVVLLQPGIPIFDLGPRKNFEQIMGDRVWEWFVPWKSNNQLDGIEWPMSNDWMSYLRQFLYAKTSRWIANEKAHYWIVTTCIEGLIEY